MLLLEAMTLNSSGLLLLGPKGEWEQVLGTMPWGWGGEWSNNHESEARARARQESSKGHL